MRLTQKQSLGTEYAPRWMQQHQLNMGGEEKMSQVPGYKRDEYGNTHRPWEQGKKGRLDADGEANDMVPELLWADGFQEHRTGGSPNQEIIPGSGFCLMPLLKFPSSWNQKFIFPEMRELINNTCIWRVWYMNSLRRHFKLLYKILYTLIQSEWPLVCTTNTTVHSSMQWH